VADKIAWLTDLLDRQEYVNFEDLWEQLPTRLERIATFLALLEMVRLQMMICLQSRQLGDIRLIRRRGAGEAPAGESAS
jgi:chromatin segregation and condensation protein Rec8/ScpA/Scc1 (kleisin family)